MDLSDHVLNELNKRTAEVRHILSNYPETRNMIKVDYVMFHLEQTETELFKKIPKIVLYNFFKDGCTIERAKRKVCEKELAQVKPYIEELKQIEKFCKKNKQPLPEKFYQIWDIVEKIAKKSKYLSTDVKLLMKKKITEDATKSWSVQD